MVTWSVLSMDERGRRTVWSFPEELLAMEGKAQGSAAVSEVLVPWGHQLWDRLMQTPSNLCLPTLINWSCGEPHIPSTCLLLGLSGVVVLIST